MVKKVSLICVDEASDLETISIRGSLEYFGYVVSTHWIGNKKQFLELLEGKTETDKTIVLCSHGTDGKFFLPTEESVSFEELKVGLKGKTIISTGCETHGASDAFLKGGCSAYIAPTGSPEGNDANFFVIKLFWLLNQGKNLEEAFDSARKDMPKGSDFMLARNT